MTEAEKEEDKLVTQEMNELHQLVHDVMLKEFGDSRNSPLKAKPTTASDPIQNIDVENIKALKNHVGEMIDKHEDRIEHKGFMSVREAELMESLKEKQEMLEEIVGDLGFVHLIFSSFGFWYFGHFSCVIFFPFFPILPCKM